MQAPTARTGPKVSVLMTAYKHERFIAQAIESVLMQNTDFDYEIVIGEDKSPDRTLEVIERYASRHPDRIRLLARAKNLGARNFTETYAACRGDYIAILEGDDYWTDPDKLQVQVDALDAHPDWVLCFHQVRCMLDGATEPTRIDPGVTPAPVTTGEDLLVRNYIPTCSLVFRNFVVREFPDWYLSLAWGDWPLTLMLAQHGKLGFIERVMADYRLHAGGSHTGRGPELRLQADIQMYRHLRQAFHNGRAPAVSRQIINRYVSLGALSLHAGDLRRAAMVGYELLRAEPPSQVLAALWRAGARKVLRPVMQHERFGAAMPLPLRRALDRMTTK